MILVIANLIARILRIVILLIDVRVRQLLVFRCKCAVILSNLMLLYIVLKELSNQIDVNAEPLNSMLTKVIIVIYPMGLIWLPKNVISL